MNQLPPTMPSPPPAYPIPVALPTHGFAITSLVFGLACWVILPFVGSMLAIFFGHAARAAIRNRPTEYQGNEMAIAGLALGYIHLALCVLVVIGVLILFGGIAALLASLHF
jgi:hypothetical protein